VVAFANELNGAIAKTGFVKPERGEENKNSKTLPRCKGRNAVHRNVIVLVGPGCRYEMNENLSAGMLLFLSGRNV